MRLQEHEGRRQGSPKSVPTCAWAPTSRAVCTLTSSCLTKQRRRRPPWGTPHARRWVLEDHLPAPQPIEPQRQQGLPRPLPCPVPWPPLPPQQCQRQRQQPVPQQRLQPLLEQELEQPRQPIAQRPQPCLQQQAEQESQQNQKEQEEHQQAQEQPLQELLEAQEPVLRQLVQLPQQPPQPQQLLSQQRPQPRSQLRPQPQRPPQLPRQPQMQRQLQQLAEEQQPQKQQQREQQQELQQQQLLHNTVCFLGTPDSLPVRTQWAVRPYSSDDHDALFNIERDCFGASSVKLLEGWLERAAGLCSSGPRGDEALRRTYVDVLELLDASKLHPVVAGYIAWAFVQPTSQYLRPYLQVLSLAVAKRHRGQRFGERLLVDMQNRGSRRWAAAVAVRLTVRHDNDSARRLYERLGFRKVATLPNFYSDDQRRYDGIEMVRALSLLG